MTALRRILALAALCWAAGAHAIPFHGCTFFGRLFPFTPACAELVAIPGGCMTWYCAPPAVCIWAPGLWVSGYMPDHFIEVTNRAGASAFATPDAPAFLGQTVAAKLNWIAHGDVSVSQASARHQLSREGHNYSFFFGRTLPMPYGPVGWTLASMGWSAGTPVPTCFSGMTEFAAETWADGLASGDRELALLWSPITVPACIIGSQLSGGIRRIQPPSVNIPAASPCAVPLPAPVQTALAVTSPKAYDFFNQCMGSLGPLFPRTGLTEGGDYTAAERVAWRTASLAEDMFRTGVGVRSDDKWQIVWPPVANASCFTPGSSLPPPVGRPSPADGTEAFLRAPAYDNTLSPTVLLFPNTEYVFAVWRHRSACMQLEFAPAVMPEVAVYYPQHFAECIPVNAANAVTGGL